MISQKIAKLTLKGERESIEMNKELKSFFSSHEYLKEKLPEESYKLLALEPIMDQIKSGILCKEENCQQVTIETIEASDVFLTQMDKLVFQLDKKFDSQVKRLSLVEYSVFTIISFIMIYEFLWVLIPFEKKIERENRKALHSAKLSTLGEMSAGIAHEINNPLAIIHGSASILKKKAGDESNKFVENILNASERIKKISEGLRRFSRGDDLDEVKEEISINTAVAEAIYFNSFSNSDFMDIKFYNNNLEDFLIHAEPTQISQVLINIIGNSIDAVSTLDKPWIKISTGKKHGKAEITITDSGSGIPDKNLKNLFSPFFTTKSAATGTGLGLSVSREIIRKLGGDIEYIKEEINTTFKITLPCV